MQKIIIDGYNVIHADEGLKREASKGMEVARTVLLRRLRAYLAQKAVQITVVFDGAGGLTDAETVVAGRLQVLYTASGQTADVLIVDTLHQHPNPREYIVVTSDMADIGRAVGAVGAVVMPSREFLDRVERALEIGDAGAEEEAGTAGREKPEPTEQDVDYWLRQFGDSGDRDD